MYKCLHCQYSTAVKCNFTRHKNRKKKCYKDTPNVMGSDYNVMGNEMVDACNVEKDKTIDDLTQKLHKEQERSEYLLQKVCNLQKKLEIEDSANSLEDYAMNKSSGSDHEDVSDCTQNVMIHKPKNKDDKPLFKCEKCNKTLTRQSYLRKHIESCNGLSKLQCEICHKFFKNRQGKYEHKNNVKCYPPTTNKFEFNSLNHLIPK